MTVEVRRMTEADLERAHAIAAESYHLPATPPTATGPSFFDGRYVVSDGDVVQGRMLVLRFGQFFGGRSVSSCGIAGVAIAPEARGRGYGSALMKDTLGALADDGVSMGVLFFSNAIPYRKVGFELAGTRIRYRAALASCPSQRGPVMLREWDAGDLDKIKDVYTAFASESAGLMDRSDFFWEVMLDPPAEDTLHRYCVERDGAVTGYVTFSQHPELGALPYAFAEGDDNMSYALATRDLVWSDADSALALLGFAEGHRAWGTALMWTGPVEDALATLFADRPGKIDSANHWMCRLLDVARALGERGYPEDANCEFEIHVSDPILESNNASFRIAVADGRATVERIGKARSQIDIGALSAIFTGWLPPRDAGRLGRMDADRATITSMETAFAGPKPWLLETF